MSAVFDVYCFAEKMNASVILNDANDGATVIANECDDVVNVIFGEGETLSSHFCSYNQFSSLFWFWNCGIWEI